MSNEALAKLIDNIAQKNYNSANKDFDGILNAKLQDTLDQAKARIAGSIFNSPEVTIAPDEELVAGEVSNDDIEAAQAADEVEAEVEDAEEIEFEYDEDDSDEEEYEEFDLEDDNASDESGEPESASEEETQ